MSHGQYFKTVIDSVPVCHVFLCTCHVFCVRLTCIYLINRNLRTYLSSLQLCQHVPAVIANFPFSPQDPLLPAGIPAHSTPFSLRVSFGFLAVMWHLLAYLLNNATRLAREFQQNLAIISRCRTFDRCAWRCLQICTRTRLSPTWSAVSSDLARLFALLPATRHTKQFTKYNKTLVHLELFRV